MLVCDEREILKMVVYFNFVEDFCQTSTLGWVADGNKFD